MALERIVTFQVLSVGPQRFIELLFVRPAEGGMEWQVLGDIDCRLPGVRRREFASNVSSELSHGAVNMLVKNRVGRGTMAMKPEDAPNCAARLMDEAKEAFFVPSRENRALVDVVSTD